jgi:hypothetical protein
MATAVRRSLPATLHRAFGFERAGHAADRRTGAAARAAPHAARGPERDQNLQRIWLAIDEALWDDAADLFATGATISGSGWRVPRA